MRKNSKIIYCKGVQHNYRLAKNTKKELGTAHHNDAFNNRNATPINLKGNVIVNTCKHINFTYHEKRIETSK